MSAYMVDKKQIDALVRIALNGPKESARRFQWHPPSFGPQRARVTFENANEVGTMLIRENLASIQARYPDCIAKPENTPGPCERYWEKPYHYPTWRDATAPAPFAPFHALSLIANYEYQSSEHEAWNLSHARLFCADLRAALVTCLPGYDKAPWGLD